MQYRIYLHQVGMDFNRTTCTRIQSERLVIPASRLELSCMTVNAPVHVFVKKLTQPLFDHTFNIHKSVKSVMCQLFPARPGTNDISNA